MKQPTVSQYWRKLEALTPTIGLASSFFPPPLDFWWKEHLCRFSITSKLQYKPVFRFSQPTWHTISKYNQNQPTWHGWLGSRVVSMLDSGAEGPRFKSQLRRCRVTVLGKLFTPILPLFNQAAKLVAALLRVAGVTAGVAESNGSLSPGLWLMSPAGWLQRTGISSGTLHSVIEYELPLPFTWHTPAPDSLLGSSLPQCRCKVWCALRK